MTESSSPIQHPTVWRELQDTPLRSVIKSISYRIFGSVSTAAISYVFTHSTTAAVSIGLTEFASKFALFYFHERTWNRIRFGRKEVFNDYQI